MAVLVKERFSSGATGDPVPTSTTVTLKLTKDDSTWKSGSTDADGFVTFDLQTTATLLPGPYYLEATVGAVTRQVHSDVYGVQGRELLGPGSLGRLFTSGPFSGVDNGMAVSAPGSGMTTRVATGLVNLQGTVAPVNTQVTLTHDAAHGSLARIDRIVARVYLDATDYGKVELAILKGTAAASPAAPNLTQSTTTVWEEMLADVTITAGLSTITGANVTDRRTFAGPAVIGSVIQAALDLLAPKASPTFTGTVTLPAVTQSGTITANSVAITPTELGYIGTLTSDAQTQLNGKVNDTGDTITGLLTIRGDLASIFTLENNSGVDVFRVSTDQAQDYVYLVNGTDFQIMSDDIGAGVKFSVDGATGDTVIAGTLSVGGTSFATALAAKANLASPTFTGTVTAADLTTTGNAIFGNGDADLHSFRGAIYSFGTSPSISAGAGTGSGGSASLIGTDVAGQITIDVGTSPTASTVCTVTFAVAKPSGRNYAVILQPGNIYGGRDYTKVRVNRAAASFTVVAHDALTASQNFVWNYVVVEYED